MGLWAREFSLMRMHGLDELIFFVTSRCNSRCGHCFYWREVKSGSDGLPLPVIEQVCATLPPFRTLLVSGGEPTLRGDLAEIVAVFRRSNGIETASIPTNGLAPELVERAALAVMRVSGDLNVTFNLSLDGPADVNDAIRGVPGGYELAMESLRRLRAVADAAGSMRVYVNTVICAGNYQHVVEFAHLIRATGMADGHFFEIVRGEPPTSEIGHVPPEELRRIYSDLVPLQEGYLRKEAKRRRGGVLGAWRQVSDMGNLINRYHHQWGAYSSAKRWQFPCQAGRAIGVIDYDGRVRVCELRPEAKSLADCQWDFGRAWASPELRRAAQSAGRHQCDCTHTCFIGAAMRQHLPSRLVAGPLLYARYRLGGVW